MFSFSAKCVGTDQLILVFSHCFVAPIASAFGKASIRCSSDQIIMLETQKGKRAAKWLFRESMEKLAYRGAITTM
jgi:hypothetical protein